MFFLWDMTISELRNRLCYVKHGGVLCLCHDPAFVPAAGVRGDLRITKGFPSGAPHPSSTLQPVELPKERAGPSAGRGAPRVSFGAPSDDPDVEHCIGGRALSLRG